MIISSNSVQKITHRTDWNRHLAHQQISNKCLVKAFPFIQVTSLWTLYLNTEPALPHPQLKSYSHPQECSRQGRACHSGAKSSMSSCRIHISLLKKLSELYVPFSFNKGTQREHSLLGSTGEMRKLWGMWSLFLCSGFRVSLLIEQLSKKKLWTAKFWGVEDAVLEM